VFCCADGTNCIPSKWRTFERKRNSTHARFDFSLRLSCSVVLVRQCHPRCWNQQQPGVLA
jgi:hypothetical protein